jgi:hypothetical protein
MARVLAASAKERETRAMEKEAELVNGFTKALIVIGSIAALAGCDPNTTPTQRDDAPEFFWDGYLIELDGVDTSDSGIRLEIRTNHSPGEPRLLYTLETGCVGGGFVEDAGEVRAFETLRPCAVEDVPRMMHLNRLSYDGQGPLPRERPATLRWEGNEATLESPLGKARFARPSDVGLASR